MRNYLLTFALLFFISLNAQDIHFSQFYASPLTLNPAMTGFVNGDCRAGVIYRNQWKRKPRYQKNYVNELLKIDLKKDTKNTIKLKIKSANPLYPGPYINVNGVKKTVRIFINNSKIT